MRASRSSWPARRPRPATRQTCVEVDYDPLEPVLDKEAAAADGAFLVHPELGTNVSATWVFDSAAAGTGGSVEDAIAAAEADPDQIVVRRRFVNSA